MAEHLCSAFFNKTDSNILKICNFVFGKYRSIMENLDLISVTNLTDVVSFFEYLLFERRLSFHPDDDFADYINIETKEPSFTPSEVELFNRLMDEAFSVCNNAGVEIYTIGLATMRRLIDPTVVDPITEGEIVRKRNHSELYLVRHADENQLTVIPIEATGPTITLNECEVVAI